jgi:hypothetical protein
MSKLVRRLKVTGAFAGRTTVVDLLYPAVGSYSTYSVIILKRGRLPPAAVERCCGWWGGSGDSPGLLHRTGRAEEIRAS